MNVPRRNEKKKKKSKLPLKADEKEEDNNNVPLINEWMNALVAQLTSHSRSQTGGRASKWTSTHQHRADLVDEDDEDDADDNYDYDYDEDDDDDRLTHCSPTQWEMKAHIQDDFWHRCCSH